MGLRRAVARPVPLRRFVCEGTDKPRPQACGSQTKTWNEAPQGSAREVRVPRWSPAGEKADLAGVGPWEFQFGDYDSRWIQSYPSGTIYNSLAIQNYALFYCYVIFYVIQVQVV